jgi:hypothetical protein
MIQRLEKVLQDAGIKLTSVTSQAYSKSARAILDALVEGERDPKVLASLVKGRLRSKRERLEVALGHRFRVEHRGVLARRLLANLDTLDAAITELDTETGRRLEPHQPMLDLLCRVTRAGSATSLRVTIRYTTRPRMTARKSPLVTTVPNPRPPSPVGWDK